MSNSSPVFLTLDEVLRLHSDLLRLFGNISAIRNRGALEPAVASPACMATSGTCLNAALVFLGLSGWEASDPKSILHEAIVAIAEHRIGKEDLEGVFRQLSRPLQASD